MRSRSAAHSQSWGQWTRWRPTTTGTPRGALALSSPPAHAPRVRTCSNCSRLNPLRVLSLLKPGAIQPAWSRGLRSTRSVSPPSTSGASTLARWSSRWQTLPLHLGWFISFKLTLGQSNRHPSEALSNPELDQGSIHLAHVHRQPVCKLLRQTAGQGCLEDLITLR